MKIQITPKLQLNSRQQQTPTEETSAKPNFKGGLDIFLNYLQTNQGVGATFTDAAFMCTPRTLVDFSRGPAAGVETMRREFSSNFNDAALGAYGLGAAILLSQGFNKKYDVRADKMRISSERLDEFGKIRYSNGDISSKEHIENLTSYLEETFGKTKFYNPAKNEWVSLGESKNDVITTIKEGLHAPTPDKKGLAKEQFKINKNVVVSLIAKDTGAEGSVKIGNSETSLADYVDDLLRATKSFMSEKVSPLFGTEKLTDAKAIEEAISKNKFLKELKGLKLGTAGLGIATCCLVGASVQPINMYLTQKKTGTTGFVGGGKKDNSAGFWALKLGVAGAAGFAMMKTIGPCMKKIISEIQFKGVWPTIPQFKFVYAVTILSRLLSSRNKNELRESSIKDSLGFANWLILGSFVSKLSAIGFENLLNSGKSKLFSFGKDSIVDNVLVKYNKADNTINGKHKPKWLAGNLVSREEVLYQAFKNAGLSTTKTLENNKIVAKSFKEMLNEASKLPGVRKKLGLLALTQIAGYAWTGLALGIAVPKLNIAITKAVEGKKKVQQANQEQKIEKEAA